MGPSTGRPAGPVEKTKTTAVRTCPSSFLFSSPQRFQNDFHSASELNKWINILISLNFIFYIFLYFYFSWKKNRHVVILLNMYTDCDSYTGETPAIVLQQTN